MHIRSVGLIYYRMIFDLHNDLPTSALSARERAIKAQTTVDTVVYAFWTTELLSPLSFIKRERRTSGAGKRLFAVEDLGFATDEEIDAICRLRPVYCGLTHNGDNALAGGALGTGGLTARGRNVIRKLNDAHIAVDAAHLNRQSFRDVEGLAEKLIDSHTGLESYCSHLRNLTDEQVQIVLRHGGIVGLTAVADFIGGHSARDYAGLIDRFVQKFGIDGACIGTDFYGTEPLDNLHGYDDFSLIAYILSSLGYTERDIDKIFFQNASNYFPIGD